MTSGTALLDSPTDFVRTQRMLIGTFVACKEDAVKFKPKTGTEPCPRICGKVLRRAQFAHT